jgi:competence protein ComEC
MRPAAGLLLFLLAALAGYAYAALRLPAVPDLPGLLDERSRGILSGVVASVEDKPGFRLEVLLDSPSFRFEDGRETPLPGRLVWTWQDPAARPAPGARVALRARPLATGGFDNPGGADWAWRWRVKNVFTRAFTQGPKNVEFVEHAPPGALEAWRMRLRQAILDAAGSGSAAGMALALITGERFAIDPADLDRVRRASLSHLLAVSGMNLAAVAAMGWGLAWLAGVIWPGLSLRIPRPKLAVLIGAPLVLGYLWLGRFEPSLMRAALMFAAWGILVLLGRSRVLLDGLLLALAAMFLFDPLCVFDVGLQLSAAAVAGLVLLAPVAGPVLARARRVRFVGLSLAILAGWVVVTFIAQLCVAPIQLSVFGEASPHLYLNLLWAPVVEWAAQPLAYLGAVTVTWLPAVGEPLLAWAGRVCAFLLESLRALDARGWLTAYPVFRPWPPEVLGFYLLLGGSAYAAAMSRARLLAWLALSAALLAGPALWRAHEQSLDRVILTMLDVGQGQALLVEAPGGRRYLIDGGGTSTGSFDVGRAALSPALTWGRAPALDGVVMSHPDRDHTGGLSYILKFYRIGFLAGNGELPRAQEFAAALASSGLAPLAWRAGERVELQEGLALEVKHPPDGFAGDSNDSSLVLRLTWRGRGLAILPGDAGRQVLEGLAASGAELGADVLVAAHHGSATALAPGFYRRVGAGWAFISCARGNAFGFPAPEVTRALGAAGSAAMTTARHGAITAVWDSPAGPPVVRPVRR